MTISSFLPGRSAAFLSEQGIPRFFADQCTRLYNQSLVSKFKVHTHYFRLRAEESKQACAQHHDWTQLVLWRTPCLVCRSSYSSPLVFGRSLCRFALPSLAFLVVPSNWIGKKARGSTRSLTSLWRRAALVKMRSLWWQSLRREVLRRPVELIHYLALFMSEHEFLYFKPSICAFLFIKF